MLLSWFGLIFFFLIVAGSPSSTLFPYTTLFRSLILLALWLGIGWWRKRDFPQSRWFLRDCGKSRLRDRKSTRLNSSHMSMSYAVFCLKIKTLDGRHDGGYYTVKDCVTIDVLPRTPGNNFYVAFMVWSNFFFFNCRGFT